MSNEEDLYSVEEYRYTLTKGTHLLQQTRGRAVSTPRNPKSQVVSGRQISRFVDSAGTKNP